jgi:peptidoglycan hydrolase-like protein with peptidoglycan-binding domain
MTARFSRPVAHPADGDTFAEHKNRPVPSVNPGQDYKVAVGTTVRAPGAGVVKVDDDGSGGGAGISVVIFHDKGEQAGWSSDLLHLSRNVVTAGQRVAEGQIVGYSGNTGQTTGPHLHWTLRNRQSTAYNAIGNVDPEKYVAADPWESVKAIQTAANVWLKYYGRPLLVVDGIAGDKTTAAIKYLQGKFGVTVDGKVGPVTWARLIAKPPAVYVPPTATEYAALVKRATDAEASVKTLQTKITAARSALA